uniref:YraN family protein n=1 Tax=Prevotella sp. TaxID=59823 RepID=UPI003FEFB186
MAEHNDFGKWGEDYAAEYLRKKGYIIMERDWTFGRSKRDIDIICKTSDMTTVVFVEVKARANDDVTNPEDAVGIRKMRHLMVAADEYVKSHDISEELRFDIVTIVGKRNSKQIKVNHIEDAFNPLLI